MCTTLKNKRLESLFPVDITFILSKSNLCMLLTLSLTSELLVSLQMINLGVASRKHQHLFLLSSSSYLL